MNKKYIIIIVIAAVMAALFLALKPALIFALITLWKNEAKRQNRAFNADLYKRELKRLSIPDLYLLKNYSEAFINRDEKKIIALNLKVRARGIPNKLTTPPLEGIIFGT